MKKGTEKKDRPPRPHGRFDFDQIRYEIKDDGTIEFDVKIAPKYEPVSINGKKAYRDKYTGDIYDQDAVIDLVNQLFSKENLSVYSTPPKTFDYCSFLRDRKQELINHWNEQYELEPGKNQIDHFFETYKGDTRVVVLFTDVEGSTKLSAELEPVTYNKIIKIFVLEMSLIIDNFNGYIFKTGGDSVIGIFPADVNLNSMCDLAVQAAMLMRSIVEDVINPVFANNGLPEIGCHIGVDIGNVTVDRHGARNIASFDEIIGHAMNLTAKIQSLAKHNEILLGRRLYEILFYRLQEQCTEVHFSQSDWSLWDPVEDKRYQIYLFSGKWPC